MPATGATPDSPIQITDVQKLSLEPNDALVLRVRDLDNPQEFSAALKSHFPDNSVLVVDSEDYEFEVVSPGPARSMAPLLFSEPVFVARTQCGTCKGHRETPSPEFAAWRAGVAQRTQDLLATCRLSDAEDQARIEQGTPPEQTYNTCRQCKGRGYTEVEHSLSELSELLAENDRGKAEASKRHSVIAQAVAHRAADGGARP